MTPALDAIELQWLDEDIDEMFHEASEVTTPVIYETMDSLSFAPTTGVYTLTKTQTTVRAIICSLRSSQVGQHETGSWIFLIRANVLPSRPKLGDRILAAGEIMEVESVRTSCLERVYAVTVREH